LRAPGAKALFAFRSPAERSNDLAPAVDIAATLEVANRSLRRLVGLPANLEIGNRPKNKYTYTDLRALNEKWLRRTQKESRGGA
jgi:hypothetical protein